MKRKTLLSLLLTSVLSAGAGINSPGNSGAMARAEAMLADRNYIGCIDQLHTLDTPALSPDEAETAAWLRAAAEAHLLHPEAISLLRDFLARHGASRYRHEARMLLGDCLLDTDPAAALAEYDRIPADGLAAHAAHLLYYHKAYAMMMLDEPQAAQYFDKIPRGSSLYPAARFYVAYLAYKERDFEVAKQNFALADRNSAPGNMADFYLAQIYYLEGDIRRAADMALALIDRADVADEYIAEACRIAGESLFDSDSRQALPYLRRYADMTAVPERSTLYLLGTTEFNEGNYTEAVRRLQPVTDTDLTDAMTQSAFLFIGQALMKQGQRDAALLAFDKALNMSYDRDVQEAAYYNYATASAEGARLPFGSSVATFEEFLRRFPDGRYAPAVQEYLVAGYLTDSNYDTALQSIERMQSPGPKVLAAKQKVLYALGTRALAAGNSTAAADYLTRARALASHDRLTDARVRHSLGEAYYRTGKYDEAVTELKAYLAAAPADDINRPLATYDLGYALFGKRAYKEAGKYFAQVVDKPGNLPQSAVVDALNRMADTYYYSGDFTRAEAAYARAYDMMPAAGDYPLFQRALIKGYRRDHRAKVGAINELLEAFPTSSLVPDALLELTEAYIQLKDNDSALGTYRRLVAAYPGTEQGRRGYLQMALTLLNTGRRADAIAAYKDVVSLYPTSEEARMAVDELKRLTADDGTLDQLGNWLATVESAPQLDIADADRLTFEAAEKAWLTARNTDRLQRYLTDYPQGASRALATGYMMEAAVAADNTGDALIFATEIADKYPDSAMAEQALAIKARAEHSLGHGADALNTWTMLESRASSPRTVNEARAGIMRVAVDLGDLDRVIAAADALLASSTLGAEERNEAIFTRALAMDMSGKHDEARDAWSELAGDTDDLYGAKSAYYLAQSYFDAKDYNAAKPVVEALIDASTPHTYWLARGFILLSDIYAAEDKPFEAREYLKALQQNYPGHETDIFQMIETRLK